MKIILLSLALFYGVGAQCVDEQGNARSWFVMLKLPTSFDYLYADNVSPTLRKGTTNVGYEESPVGRVAREMYTDSSTNFMVYNDHEPGQLPPSDVGHTKGAVIWKKGGTIQWLVHSVPNFLAKGATSYKFPKTGRKNGQSFLCVTMREQDLALITNHLYYTHPNIYTYRVDQAYKDNVPLLNDVLNGQQVQQSPWTKVQTFTTSDMGTTFTAFAKNGQWGKDIYKDLIAEHYFTETGNVIMYTETWQNTGVKVLSDCSGNTKVYNNILVKFVGEEYKKSQDHSKWAVTEKGQFCVGGINRITKQFERGGGSLCFNAGSLASEIYNGVLDFSPCPETQEI